MKPKLLFILFCLICIDANAYNLTSKTTPLKHALRQML